MDPLPLLLLESNSGVFLSFLRALTSWLLSKKRGINGPSGERGTPSAAFFLSAFLPRWAGAVVGDTSSFTGKGGGGGGGGGEIGDPSSEVSEQGEQDESAGLGTGRGGSDAVRDVTGWVVSVELGSVCTPVLRHSGWPCSWTQSGSARSSFTPTISVLLPWSLLLVWVKRSRVDFRMTWPGYR